MTVKSSSTNIVLDPDAGLKDSTVSGRTSLGVEISATVLHVTRYIAVFEIYGPALAIRVTEVFDEFKIVVRDRVIYRGRAVVHGLVEAGLKSVCEVTLNEQFWINFDFSAQMVGKSELLAEFQNFMRGWQKFYRVLPEYKVIIADMQSFLSDMRIWLDQMELSMRSLPAGDQARVENEVADELALVILPCIDVFFEKFELIAESLEEELRPAHRHYMRRQLHPYILSAPFAWRAFHKPLGYAGDYEMVNMMARGGQEGGSLFAKIVNSWFIRQPPAQAHRNRIVALSQNLAQETLRVNLKEHRTARIFDMACGPAQEIQKFLAESPLSGQSHITLLDFNEETLERTRSAMDVAKSRYSRSTSIDYIKKSVHHLIKESAKIGAQPPAIRYDFVYCAGLFDYLSDQVCLRLMDLMYEWLAPGGLLVATNVEPSNPHRNGMDYLLDWHLIYRTSREFQKLIPTKASADEGRVHADPTGVNLFLEVRKPAHD